MEHVRRLLEILRQLELSFLFFSLSQNISMFHLISDQLTSNNEPALL